MADLGSQKIGSNYQKLLSIDGGEIQDSSGSAPTANLNLTGNITASGDISASGTIYANDFQSAGGDVGGISFVDDLNITGDITASGNISGSSTSTGSFGRVEAEHLESSDNIVA